MEDVLQQRDQEIDRITGDCNSYKTELTQLQAAGAALKGVNTNFDTLLQFTILLQKALMMIAMPSPVEVNCWKSS